jgi:site-specific DNA-methyltransferase (adenine-specific)
MRSSGLWGGKANQQSFRLATAAKSIPDGLKPKDLIGIPWRLAFALQDDGWYLRGDYIWHKPNPMPESVTDRCTKAHEYIFHLTKSERYFWDQEAIKEMATYGEPNSPQSIASPYGQGFTRNAIGAKGNANGFRGGAYCNGSTFDNAEGGKRTTRGNRKAGNKSYKYVDQYEIDGSEQHRTKAGLMKVADVEWMGRNKRSVWTMATTPFPEAHFATFPPELPETCIKAGSKPGDTILDPFGGAGTTGLVADRLQRNAVLIELNADYAAMAERRIDKDRGGLLDIMETQSS